MDSDEITSRLSSWQAPFYWENLGGYSHETHLIQGRKIHFIVERCREGHEHVCTVDDVAIFKDSNDSCFGNRSTKRN